MSWQPISTAPRDGTKVAVRGPDWVAVAAWESNAGLSGVHWIVYENGYVKVTPDNRHSGGYAVTCRPTHWMPLA